MTQKIYAGYITASWTKTATKGGSTAPVAIGALNEDEAQGKAIRLARERYSASAGFYNHAAEVMEIPAEWIQSVLGTSEGER